MSTTIFNCYSYYYRSTELEFGNTTDNEQYVHIMLGIAMLCIQYLKMPKTNAKAFIKYNN